MSHGATQYNIYTAVESCKNGETLLSGSY